MENTIKSVCGFCGSHCRITVTLEEGKVIDIKGDSDKGGMICKRGKSALEYLYNPHRLKYPLKRQGRRGEGKWEVISWEEAFRFTAENLNNIKQSFGPEAVFFCHGYSKAYINFLFMRLGNVFGTPNQLGTGNVCHLPRMYACLKTFGFFPKPDVSHNTNSILLWGTNKYNTSPVSIKGILEAQKRGTKLVVIDPVKTNHAKKADLWLKIKPGTDLALAMGMLNVIINEKLHDKDFIGNWTIGFDNLKKAVEKYTPSEVSKITWIPVEQIIEAARIYAKLSPSVILAGNALDHNADSFQKGRAMAILMAVTGNVDIPGGEFDCTITDKDSINAENVRTCFSPEFKLSNMLSAEQKRKKVGKEWTLLEYFAFTSGQAISRAVLDEIPYKIRGGFIQGTNPVSGWANVKRTREAFKNLDFLAVSDFFMTPTANLADIVFPASTHLEYDGIRELNDGSAVLQRKIQQVGQCRSDIEIINGLAKELGFEKYFWTSLEKFWDYMLEPSKIKFKEFKKLEFLPPVYDIKNKNYKKYEKGGFKTPSGKVEIYIEELKNSGIDPMPEYKHIPQLHCEEDEYPFVCTNYKAASYMHSNGKQIECLRKNHPHPTAFISAEMADNLGLQEGQWIYIETPQGKIKQKVKIVEDIDNRVICLEYGWWYPEMGAEEDFGIDISGYNALTNDGEGFGKELSTFNIRGLACKAYKAE